MIAIPAKRSRFPIRSIVISSIVYCFSAKEMTANSSGCEA